MSIINDALKRAQVNLKKTEEKQDNEDGPSDPGAINVYEKLYKAQDGLPGVSPGHQTRKKKRSKDIPPRRAKKFGTILVAILCFLCVSGIFLLGMRYHPAEKFFRSVTAKSNSLSTRPPIAHIPPAERPYKTGELVLNGTSLIDGKRVALINDEIYEIGETVEGKEIIGISLNRVELRDGQKIVILKVR